MSPDAPRSVTELLAARRSIRRFRAEPPPHQTIADLLAAAVTAPSASNRQPWRFVVVSRRETIAALSRAVDDAVRELEATVTPAFAASFAGYAGAFSAFAAAPVVVAVLFRPLALLGPLLEPTTPGDLAARVHDLERLSAAASAAMALENLLLAAPALGLGACPMTGALIARPALGDILAIEPPWEALALVAVGWPDEEPMQRSRIPAERVTRWIE